MKERLESTLIAVARRYAPSLVPANWARSGDYPRPLPELAGDLARYNVLVLMGDVPIPHTNEATVQVKLWADTYAALYRLIASELFPSYADCKLHYADREWPPIVVLYGQATPLILKLSGYVAPFVTARQGTHPVSDVELRGLADLVLDELEAADLPRGEYRHLRDQIASLVRDLLTLPVRQMPVTPAEKPIFGLTASLDLKTNGAGESPPEDEEPPQPSSEQTNDTDVPMFFERRPRGTKPLPPPPDIPDDEDRD
jgi:hypothetical protein